MSTNSPYGAPPPHDPPAPAYGQPPAYGQAPAYGQPPAYGQAPGSSVYSGGYGSYPGGPPGYASWGARVGASLLDALLLLPGMVVIGIGYAVTFASAPGTASMNPETGVTRADFSLAGPGLLVVLLGYVLVFALAVWNRCFRAGRTGQSWGRKVVGIRLVSQQTGQPIGAGLAFGRELCHYVDSFFYLGYLWPLWDDRRQTFADKICSTVVVQQH